jgi:hypothetical protein
LTPGERSTDHPASDRVEAGQHYSSSVLLSGEQCTIQQHYPATTRGRGGPTSSSAGELFDFIQPRQMCRSVQDGTDKHLFYLKRYTIPGMKIQAIFYISSFLFLALRHQKNTCQIL